jgi:hypothetical protein
MGHPATVLFVFLALSLSHVRYVHPFVSNPPMFPSKTEQFMNHLFARIILHENTKKKREKGAMYTAFYFYWTPNLGRMDTKLMMDRKHKAVEARVGGSTT